jgi:protein TonB
VLNTTPQFVAPVDIPDDIGDGAVDFGVPGGVEGGVPGGIIGGIVGGLPSGPPPPPPKAAPVRVGGEIREPTRTVYVQPIYPEIAKQARVSGVVILEAIIDPNGNVTNISVLRSIPLLDQSAMDAVRQWRYQPTLLNGVPVPIVMTVTVTFNLG